MPSVHYRVRNAQFYAAAVIQKTHTFLSKPGELQHRLGSLPVPAAHIQLRETGSASRGLLTPFTYHRPIGPRATAKLSKAHRRQR